MVTHSSSGKNLSIVFLDTEGFSSRNVSELYDAKIFAVTSLLSFSCYTIQLKLSTRMIWNILSCYHVERDFSFKLRSTNVYHESFDHDLLSFPPLIWVVQDFVRSLKSGGNSNGLAE